MTDDNTHHRETNSAEALPQVAGGAPSRVVRNSAFNVLGMALILPLNFIALFTLARRLGKESLGIVFTLVAISAVVFLVSSSGVTTCLMRRIAQSRDRMRQIVGEAAVILVVVCVASTVAFLTATWVWSVWSETSLGWSLLLTACLAMIARHSLEFAVAAVRGAERFEFENIARVVQSGVYCLLILGLVESTPQGTFWAFVAFGVSNFIAAFGLILMLVWRFDCRQVCCPWSELKGWYRESWPLGMGDVLRQIGWQAETLMLATLSVPAAVGLYSIAYRPLQPLQMLPRALVSALFPTMTRQAVEDKTALSDLVGQSTGLLWLLSLPLSISVMVCARQLVLATAGPAYEAAVLPLQLLIWLTGLTFVNTQLRFVFSAVGWERAFCRIAASVLVIKLVVGAALIAVWGLYGACASIFVGECLLAAWGSAWLSATNVTHWPWRQFCGSTAAAAVMSLLLLPVINSDLSLNMLLGACVVGSSVFLVLCIAFGALPWQQVSTVARGLRRMLVRSTSGPHVGSTPLHCVDEVPGPTAFDFDFELDLAAPVPSQE